MVAALCTWHEHHELTKAEIERSLRIKDVLIFAAPSLVETYAVLTRLPLPHRLSIQDALVLLESNWGGAGVVALTPSEYWKLLRDCRDTGIGGGQVYDAVIMACARKARVERLLTWNLEHFTRFDENIIVTAPGQR